MNASVHALTDRLPTGLPVSLQDVRDQIPSLPSAASLPRRMQRAIHRDRRSRPRRMLVPVAALALGFLGGWLLRSLRPGLVESDETQSTVPPSGNSYGAPEPYAARV